MAFTYRIVNLNGGGGSDDRRTKVSSDDTTPGFLEEKIGAASNKVILDVTLPGGDETLTIDVDETKIDHDQLENFDPKEHAPLDDTVTSSDSLWSSQKIQTELDGKINAATPMTDNKLVKSVGTSGIDVEATGIDVDDSNNVTGINNLIIDGDLVVNGNQTDVNTEVLNVEDANITINKGGTQASADTQDAGLTVEMSDADDAVFGYDSTLNSSFKVGTVGDLHEVVSTNHEQTLLNKTINVDNNTVTNIETDNFKPGVIQDDLNGAVSDTNLASSEAIKEYVDAKVAEHDDASEISYDPADPSNWDNVPSFVDEALDELADRVDDAEDLLDAHLDNNPGKHKADQIINIPNGNLAADNVQDALYELQTDVDNVDSLKKDKEVVSAVDPTVNDDSYDIGQIWVNTTDENTFILIDNASGAAKWVVLAVKYGVAKNINTGICYATLQDAVDDLNDFESLFIMSGDHSSQSMDFTGSNLSNITIMGFGSSGTSNTVVGQLLLDDTCNFIEMHNIDFFTSGQDTYVDTGSTSTSFNECLFDRGTGSTVVRLSGNSAVAPRFSNCRLIKDVSINGSNFASFAFFLECEIKTINHSSNMATFIKRCEITSDINAIGLGIVDVNDSTVPYIGSTQGDLGIPNLVLNNVTLRDPSTGNAGQVQKTGAGQYRILNCSFNLANSTLNGQDLSEQYIINTSYNIKGKTKAQLNSTNRVSGQLHYATDEGNAYLDDGTQLNQLAYVSQVNDVDGNSFIVNKAFHGYSVLDVVYTDGTEWLPALADNAETLGTHVIVEIIDADNFKLAQAGRYNIPSHGLSLGEYYFTSQITAGSLSANEGNSFSNPLVLIDSADTIIVLPFRPSYVDNTQVSQQILDLVNDANQEFVTNFVVNPVGFRSFEGQLNVEIDADQSIEESFYITGHWSGTEWNLNIESIGNDSDVQIDMFNSGQLHYSCPNYSGFNSGKITFKYNLMIRGL